MFKLIAMLNYNHSKAYRCRIKMVLKIWYQISESLDSLNKYSFTKNNNKWHSRDHLFLSSIIDTMIKVLEVRVLIGRYCGIKGGDNVFI